MATINGIYFWLGEEKLKRVVDVSTHTAETGVDFTDNVKEKAKTISIDGEIVGQDSAAVQSKFDVMMRSGTIIEYIGRNVMMNAVITSFDTSHPNTIWGGCSFTMGLQQIRFAKSSYIADDKETAKTQEGGTQQVSKNNDENVIYHTVKKGDTVWDLVASNNAPYKKYGLTCQQVIDKNPSAFSRKGDAKTLQIGKKIIVGYKEVDKEKEVPVVEATWAY